MKAIRALEIALSGFGEAALHGGFSPPAEMKRYAHELDRRFGSPDSDRPRVDRREPVLIRLLAQYRIESARDIK